MELTTINMPVVALRGLTVFPVLTTSFDAEPGDSLVLVTNLDGVWLRDGANYWNCTLPRHDANLVSNLELIPQAAERGLAKACKDVSMAGIAGTLVMLCEASGVGCELDCDSIPLPAGCDREADLEPWLRAFFSYGFLLAAREENLPDLVRPFLARGLYVARIGVFTSGSKVMLWQGGSTALLHDWAETPFTGYQGRDGGRP